MSEVDDRIVSMKFDNALFERKLSETIASLDKLRGNLNFSGAKASMGEITSAANAVNLSSIANATDHIASKFNAMTAIATAALSRLTFMAVDAAVRIGKSFTVGPIIDGFHEFETNMNSIQTILANTKADGSTLEDVNSALDKLNHYSDQTIYNFSEMARNIGTFTAAGVNLEDSVNAIKGIANLAAISGSNSQQASTAMYQLSQALAAGKVNLMDWNSVVNAGMGGEVFKKALFETGKAMKTITDVPLGASFEEWEKKGGTFREQMEKGWLTADVLKTTLGAFSGDLDEAALKTMGFGEAAAREMVELGKTGQAAATEVKTFTQLLGTIKEAVGSGWSATFKTVIGDFEESKALFTGINSAIGAMVSNSADARNQMLAEWKFFGGRDVLIQGFTDALKGLGAIVTEVKEAFREFFPRTTGLDLANMTKAFADFISQTRPSAEAMNDIKSAFRGVFAALSIGWEVIKNVARLFGELFGVFDGAGGSLLHFAGTAGDAVVQLQGFLVGGGAILRFFDDLREYISKPIDALNRFKEAVAGFFHSFDDSPIVEGAVERVSTRFSMLEEVAHRISQTFERVKSALEGVWNAISDWFKDLGKELAEVLGPGDFDAAIDAINVGLLTGIAVLLRKFWKNGLKVDLSGGFMDKIKTSLDTLTGTLKAMQTDLKAKALLKIAGAIGILTASLLVLSTIDSAALTKALVAMSVGFGQLMTVMIALDHFIGSAGSAAKIGIVATGLIALSTAMLILSAAIKNMASLSWGELARGLAGATAGIGMLIGVTHLINTDAGGMISAGIALGAIATAMYILAQAVQAFATLSWEDLAKGLTGVGVGLGVITLAMNFMPAGPMLAAGLAMIPLATGLSILAGAVALFATMSWESMAQGLVGVGGSLLIIAGAMHLMPLNLPVTAAGMVILAGAMTIMAGAIKILASMSLGEMAKGLGALAVTLGILVIAMNTMQGSLAGAAALVIVAGALVVLTGVLKVLGNMSIASIVTSLVALAATLAMLGIAAAAMSEVVPVLFALGASIALLGGGFAAFGLGVMFIAKAFEILSESGRAGAKAIVDIIAIIITARVTIVHALTDSIIMFAKDLLNAAPLLIKSMTVILGKLLDAVITLAPKLAFALITMFKSALTALREIFPDLVETGYLIFLTLLRGIRDHIVEIISLGTEIITNLATGLVQNMPVIVAAAAKVLISFLTEVANHVGDLVAAGLGILVEFLNGIAQNIGMVVEAATNVITTFLGEIAQAMNTIISYGVDLLVWLLKGIADNIGKIVTGVEEIIVTFIETLGGAYLRIIDAGFTLLKQFIAGILLNLIEITNMVGTLVAEFIRALGEKATAIAIAGGDAIIAFLNGVTSKLPDIIKAGTNLIIAFIQGIGEASLKIVEAAIETLLTFMHALADMIEIKTPELMSAGRDIAAALVKGIIKGVKDMAKDALDAIGDFIGGLIDKAKDMLHINSPSRVFIGFGRGIGEGMAMGIDQDAHLAANSAVQMAEKIVRDFSKTLAKVPEGLPGVDIEPTITPVLDLSRVQDASRRLDGMLAVSTIAPSVSFDQAREIATTTERANEGVTPPAETVPTEVTFEQNIYSPTALSTADIYRGTKSQIALMKEELDI